MLDAQYLANRPIGRNRIAGRTNRAEAEPSTSIGVEDTAQIHRCLFRVLVFILPCRGRGPDMHLHTGQRYPIGIGDPAGCGPSVLDRTMLPPFSVSGDPSRQNRPSKADAFSVARRPPRCLAGKPV